MSVECRCMDLGGVFRAEERQTKSVFMGMERKRLIHMIENVTIVSQENILDDSFSLFSPHFPPTQLYLHIFKTSENNPQWFHHVSQMVKAKILSQTLKSHFTTLHAYPLVLTFRKPEKNQSSLPLKYISTVTNLTKLSPTERKYSVRERSGTKVKKAEFRSYLQQLLREPGEVTT